MRDIKPLDRSTAPELMDELDGVPFRMADLRRNLRDIARYNTWLGANALMVRLVREVLAGQGAELKPFVGLDVGIGAGDFLRYVSARVPVSWVSLDASTQILTIARDLGGSLLGSQVCALGEQLPFADGSFDVVTCALTVHHLQPAQVIQLWHEFARISRRGFAVVDFRRSHFGLVGAWLLTRLTSTNAFTRNDGVQSIRRAYTVAEARAMLGEAGLPAAQVRPIDPLRYAMVWRRDWV